MPSKTPTIGLLGGGQLGRMLCEAASPLDISIAILDEANAPAKQINSSAKHVVGSFKDPARIQDLAAHCDVLTVEIEHIETDVLEEIDTKGVQGKKVAVHPSWRTLRLIQDKFAQKDYLGQEGLPIAEQMALEEGEGMLASLEEASRKFGFPWMLKARKGSYDGRGNLKISGKADLEQAVKEFGRLSCYAEKWVPFELELAVMVIRTEDDSGKTKRLLPYPVVETVHEDNICSKVFMPPRNVPAAVCEKAQKVACGVVEKLWGRGVFAVEMFLTKYGDVMVNEIAPRPHNSGHYTIEAVPYMSQYKAQLYSILDEPLPEVLEAHVSSSIMINILGGASQDSHHRLVEQAKKMYAKGTAVYPHLYGKESKPSRKIGHITLTGSGSIQELEKYAQPLIQIADEIRQERLKAASQALRPSAAPKAAPNAAAKGDALVLVTMGSDSDLPVLKAGIDILNQFGVPWTVDITSAHRTPSKMAEVATEAASRGIKVIIAAAGGAAHLPGMIAAYTPLPVIGVPVKATHLDGLDSLLSIVQMPRGVPTATVAINNSTNAALLAIRFLGAFIPDLHEKMRNYQLDMEKQVHDKANLLKEIDVQAYLEKMGKK
ncbi:regulated by circadian rhythms/ air carboxylase [Cryphonectria parasitica EP155]|uniref:Phosphoribosylaminoimidazole carboxylase n=1 Tax=Cryphonectria parasitica (strain ATCC 38755 / EP155) TaxID=660469 RepID=A0A9P4XWE2_CRYP1|nr:regulated by circadian rhythms/ air carboxylase [Cryphonectria parasitica EP155]KAF3762519.1 regulated by circadian rhythms/ air carboxylase [Cryphonectria parasitica EP155]